METKSFIAIWGNGEYKDDMQITNGDNFTIDQGYDIEDQTNIDNLDVFEVLTLSIGHKIIRLR